MQMHRAHLALPFLLSACAASHTGSASLDVEASIASVTLGDACGAPTDEPGAPPPAEPAGDVPAEDAAPGRIGGDCDGPGCGGCRETALQLALEAGPGDVDVPFEVLSVRLLDMDGREVGTLEARQAWVFTDESYVRWDERIAPSTSVSVRYVTTAPDWQRIGDGDAWSTFGMRFRVRVRVLIDGEERTLDFSPAMREPEIVT